MTRAITWLASFATILGVSIANAVGFWSGSSDWRKLFLIVVVAGTLIWGWIDFREWLQKRPKRYKSQARINVYMCNLLSRGGTAYIFAHNLTWVDDSVREFIAGHAANRLIRLYVPSRNQITNILEQYGAQIVTYSSLNYAPEARFTLLNPHEPGSSLLAVGKGAVPYFFIEEFTDAGHARVISIARDLFAILDRLDENQ